MKKRVFAVILCLTAFLLCPVQVQCATQGVSKSVTDKDVTITITTDKEEYAAGEEIHYSITVENGRDNWDIQQTSFTYSNTDGLNPKEEGSMPDELPEILSGESFTLNGTLVGSEEVFGSAGGAVDMLWMIPVGVAVLAVIIFVVILLLKKKKGIKVTSLLLALLFFSEVLPVQASEETELILRPYVKFIYAGREVMIRAVMNLEMEQQLLKIESEDRLLYQKITCHDPSIFKDFDGKYYIFGTFLCGGYSDNLYDWTNMDAAFQATFTEETRAQIKEWNKDEKAGSWNGYLWAPDVVYNPNMEKYCMYLSANGDDWKSNIVLLTADKADGPYDYAGTIIYGGFNAEDYAQTDAPLVLSEAAIPERYVTNGVDNKKWGDMWPNCIDPCTFFDEEGNLWMAYGSWSGGIFMLKLDPQTGLRDYTVSYETDLHSDAYFGKKIAGGSYVSGEGSYIQKIGDYYYLFISYGNLEAAGGYNVRVFRSERPDGDYVDMLGNTPYYDTYEFNYNLSNGVRLMGGYKWRNFNNGQVAQGHNSAFVDDDGKAYMVFHTRTDNGSEGHYVKVHQLFVTKEGWLVAAPYQTTGETLKQNGFSAKDVAGEYEVILHEPEIDYKALETKRPQNITLSEDGKISGALEGSWQLEPGTPYITLRIDGEEYSGVTLSMQVEYTTIETMVFTAVGLSDQVTLWGSKSIE